MRKRVIHDVAVKHKKSYSFKNNAAVNPYVLVAVLAAVTVVIWVIAFFAWRVYAR